MKMRANSDMKVYVGDYETRASRIQEINDNLNPQNFIQKLGQNNNWH